MRNPTLNRGAALERAAFVAYLKRLSRKPITPDAKQLLDTILTWVKNRQKRYDPRPGGIGRKPKKTT